MRVEAVTGFLSLDSPPLSHKCPAREIFGGIPLTEGRGSACVGRLGGRARGVVVVKHMSPQGILRTMKPVSYSAGNITRVTWMLSRTGATGL